MYLFDGRARQILAAFEPRENAAFIWSLFVGVFGKPTRRGSPLHADRRAGPLGR